MTCNLCANATILSPAMANTCSNEPPLCPAASQKTIDQSEGLLREAIPKNVITDTAHLTLRKKSFAQVIADLYVSETLRNIYSFDFWTPIMDPVICLLTLDLSQTLRSMHQHSQFNSLVA